MVAHLSILRWAVAAYAIVAASLVPFVQLAILLTLLEMRRAMICARVCARPFLGIRVAIRNTSFSLSPAPLTCSSSPHAVMGIT
jgi:hypothetical protein